MKRLPILTLCLLLAAPAALAQVPEERAEAFIETADLDRSTTDFAAQLRQMVMMQSAQFPAPAGELFTERLGAGLEDEAIRQRLRDYVTEHAHADSLEAALAWSEQPIIASGLAQIREASTDPRAEVPIQMYAQTGQLGRHTVTPEREELAREYMRNTGADQAATEMMMELMVESSRFNAMLLDTEMPQEDVLRAQVRQQFGDQMTAPMRAMVLYATREVDTDQFAEFVEMSDTDAARYYNRLATDGMTDAVVGGMMDGAQQFLRELEALDAAGELDLDAWRQSTLEQMQQQMPQAPAGEGEDAAAPAPDNAEYDH